MGEKRRWERKGGGSGGRGREGGREVGEKREGGRGREGERKVGPRSKKNSRMKDWLLHSRIRGYLKDQRYQIPN